MCAGRGCRNHTGELVWRGFGSSGERREKLGEEEVTDEEYLLGKRRVERSKGTNQGRWYRIRGRIRLL